jgi:D-methionine transport system substrate-binding protein
MQTYTERQRRKLRFALAVAALAVVVAFSLAGCGAAQQASGGSASGDDKTITVAAVPTPQGEILENAVAPLLEADGYTLEVKEFTDYVQPNTVTEEGDVDANYYQHIPYLDNFNEEQGTHLVAVEAVHFEPMGIYAGKSASLDALPDGATVAVPNDATNEARALLLLAKAGLIEVKDPTDVNTTVNDITSNPKNLKFNELEAANVPNVLQDVDIAVINGNYALAAGLSVSKDSLAVETADSAAAQTYANYLVVKEGNEDTDKTKELEKALNSDEARDYINSTFDGAVVPVF